MEITEEGLLEELLAPRRESWNTFHQTDFLPNVWSFESSSSSPPPPLFYQQDSDFLPLNSSSLLGLITTTQSSSSFVCNNNNNNNNPPFLDDTTPFQAQDDGGGELGMVSNHFHGFQEDSRSFGNDVKLEDEASRRSSMGVSNVLDVSGDKKIKAVKKLEGQPSKNLMAERRRRKRLNDRLSMLRSIVPKISKMDRTSILGDTIDYMKELLDKIHTLREDDVEDEIKDLKFVGNVKELKPNEAIVRKPPKFEVERRNVDTRIEICCGAKPGLLLSTVSTLEALGLDVQQCVISCFNDFSLQASCSEAEEHRTILSTEDVKQTLFRTAGYGGRCL